MMDGIKQVELVVVGAGPAGMSAAVAAYDAGIRDILILERDDHLGGILYQCIHNGFGLHRFGEELTGPEYSWRYEQMVAQRGIEYKLHTMVLDMSADKVITAVNADEGIFRIQAKAVVLAMGCRERARGALNIAGSRPAGIYTAGTAQRFVNIMGYMPGRQVVILGSGDIGLIMARRMTLEGAQVKMVCELLPYSGGLTRNIVQCLNDYDIPLRLSHTVTQIHGKERLEGVTVCQVDKSGRPMAETAEYVGCDTLLLSVGLIPENELTRLAGIDIDPVTGGAVVDQSRETSIEGVFACGNVLQVHDLVDFVSEEAETAGRGAAEYITCACAEKRESMTVAAGDGVRYVVPQRISGTDAVSLYFRVRDVYKSVTVLVKSGDEIIYKKKARRVAPGEMERVDLDAARIAAAGQTLTVMIDRGDAK